MATGPLLPQPDADPRGFRGLPPFVDVVYGAVLGFGVFKIEEAIRVAGIPGKGNETGLFLSIVTSIYLVFDYAYTKMCIGKYPYRTLTRYTVDMFSAIAFVFAYVAANKANRASPYYLLWLAILLTLSAFWIVSLDKEYPNQIRRKFLTHSHAWPVMVLFLTLIARLFDSTGVVDQWIIYCVGFAFLAYSFGLSLVAYLTDVNELERGLLPIIPFYALIDAFMKSFQLRGDRAG
jgi:hypothetical protein